MRSIYPSHEEQLERLNKIEGQIKGVRKMIDERRYCIDIILQIKAIGGGLDKIRLGVLESHIHHCVKESAEANNPTMLEEKVLELVQVLGKMD